MFKMFARDESRLLLSELIKDENEDEEMRKREAWKSIHLQLCALAIVAQSQCTMVDIDLFKDVSTEVYLRIVEELDWVQIPESIHGLMAHAGELMANNDNKGLGSMSEGGLERQNQGVKYWRKFGARKSSAYDNMKDAMNHQTQASSPLLDAEEPKRKRRPAKKIPEDTVTGQLRTLVERLFLDDIHRLDRELLD